MFRKGSLEKLSYMPDIKSTEKLNAEPAHEVQLIPLQSIIKSKQKTKQYFSCLFFPYYLIQMTKTKFVFNQL